MTSWKQPAPRVEIDEFALNEGRIDWQDAAVRPSQNERIEAIDIKVQHFSTAARASSPVSLGFQTGNGETFKADLQVTSSPLALDGRLALENLQPGRHAVYLQPFLAGEIADGKRPGDVEAAKQAFAELGEIAGDAMATAVTLVDGLIVIGGGITAARKYIMPSLLKELRGKMHTITGEELNRVQMKVYDLDNEEEFKEFAKGDQRALKVYGTDRYVAYDPQKRIGVMISKLGASNAISVGAYAFALSQLDAQKQQ